MVSSDFPKRIQEAQRIQGGSMEYIIDGYNLIKCSYLKKFENFSGEHARQVLFQILTKYYGKHPSVKITVVFDGIANLSGTIWPRGVQLIFSDNISADEKIRDILKTKKTDQPVVVVSDDKEVRMTARILGKEFTSTRDFLDLVAPLPQKPAETSQEKTEDYRQVISIKKELKEFYEKRNKGI